MQLVTEVKKVVTSFKGDSPKRKKSPERQVDLTRVLETIDDKNQSIKNSTNENYYTAG